MNTPTLAITITGPRTQIADGLRYVKSVAGGLASTPDVHKELLTALGAASWPREEQCAIPLPARLPSSLCMNIVHALQRRGLDAEIATLGPIPEEYGHQPRRLYMSMDTQDDFKPHPLYASFLLSHKNIETIYSLSMLCQANNLESCTVKATLNFTEKDAASVAGHTLHVSSVDFWFTGYLVHDGDDVYTPPMWVSDLLSSPHTERDIFWAGDGEVRELKELVAEDLGIDLDDILDADERDDNEVEIDQPTASPQP